MRVIRSMLLVFAVVLSAVPAAAQPPRQPQQQEEFVPIDQLPADEQVAAAPMVVAAYSVVWIAFVGYVFTLVRRIKKVEADLASLERSRR
jgi:CcmD family protein